MKIDQLDGIRTWFDEYVGRFFDSSGSLPPPLDIKYLHSQRVASHARTIAERLCWDEEAVFLGEALGWLHDVGRFSQFAEFGHFYDVTSVNHAERGWHIIRDLDILSSLSEKDRRCLLEGIRYHNARTIPEETNAACLPLVKLIRDADKLDIYRVVIEHLQKDGFQELRNMWPHVALEGPVSQQVLHEIQEKGNCSIARITSLADFLLLQVGWVYDLHYPPTCAEVLQRGILDALAEYLPDEEGPRDVLKRAREFVLKQAGGL